MKKILIGILSAAVLLGGTAAALPWWFGLETKKAFRSLLAASDRQSGMATELKSYERGWLGATAETVTRHPTLPLELHSHHDIRHGPLTPGAGLGLTRIESRMVLHTRSAQHQQELSRIPALRAVTTEFQGIWLHSLKYRVTYSCPNTFSTRSLSSRPLNHICELLGNS